MNVKKYLAPSLQEAVDQMKTELGEEAIIISTRILNTETKLGSKKIFEVLATTESEQSEKSFTSVPETTKSEEKSPKKEKIERKDDEAIESELSRLRERISRVYQKETPSQKKTEDEPEEKTEVSNKDFEELKEQLLDKDIQLSIVNKIIDQVSRQSPFIQAPDLDQHIMSTIASMIQTAPFGVNKRRQGKVIALVGPTGVGKTTCIAKLAVISKILHKLDVGLITIDTYRLGALDQLKVFSQISNIEFFVAYEPNDIPKLMNKMKKKDIIFLDTAGRSQNNQKLLNDMKTFLSTLDISEVLLVLSATSTTQHMVDVANKFRVMDYSGFIVTKLDEAASYGNILNVLTKFPSKPIKFLTNGQVIPDDIIAADSDFIANIVYSGKFM